LSNRLNELIKEENNYLLSELERKTVRIMPESIPHKSPTIQWSLLMRIRISEIIETTIQNKE
jgi:hypothetical protein